MKYLYNRMNEFDNEFNKFSGFDEFSVMMVAWSTSNTSYPQLKNG